ncbi:hypothetical protein JRO89_XS12G0040600 [Xanthoceras sorbifolium]|uniref:SANTA domain-containing protein n=1 Tax=Xanthoceras sorbifolium TaxID=99658 RepID=A0ABQ8HAZ8_9ROSI|nr:hypothetical protein JRO89_XS12G0040600 [Xanthoceras sorbifolium]
MNTSLLNRLLSPIASAHASHQRCNNSNYHDDDEESSSHFQTTVCLYDWWLIKADKDFEGKRLAVAGFTSRELQAMRVFTSAPIVKRYDIFTLETADGICIVLKGFINKSRTKENGFSAEVLSHFLFGFPPHWEAYIEKCLEEEFTTGAGLVTVININSSVTEHEFTAVAGMTDANLNTTPINYEVNGKNKHSVEDLNECSANVSEKVTTNASKGFDWQNHAAEDNNIEKAKDHASENLLPSMSCDINAVSLRKDNLALPAEHSSHNVTGSPERMANSKSCSEGSKGTVRKSKTQEPASLESLTISNAALAECPIPKASDVENLNSANLVPAVPVGDSSLDLRITSTNSKPQEPACLESITISNAALGECPLPKASDIENLNSSNLDPAVSKGDSGLDLYITSRKSKIQEPACLESITISNAASGECSIPKVTDIENLNSSNLDPAVVGNPGVDPIITSSRPEILEQQEEDGVTCANKDFSIFSLPQEFVATVRCTGEKSSGFEGSSLSSFGLGVTHAESLSTSPINEDPNYQKLSGTCVDDTMNSPAVSGFTPTKVHTNALNVTPSNSGSRKNWNQNKHSGFTGSMKRKGKELRSETSKHLDGESLKMCSSGKTIHSGKKIDMLESARSQSIKRMVSNMTGNSKGKEKERHTTVLALKSKRYKMGLAALVSDRTSNLEGMNMFDFCDNELQQPVHDTVVKNNSTQGKDHRKKSQAGTPMQKPSTSDGSRNEVGDTHHQYESETAVGQREATAKGSSSKKKARRRINFDTQARPLTRGRRDNIVSPEFLSLKRSRSGRLLLPSLDFWRNQIAVYDADRRVTGIQVATPSKGSKSEPPNKRRQ